jgi:hypothetical protein
MHHKGSRGSQTVGHRPSVLMMRFALASLQYRTSKMLSEARREYPATLPASDERRQEARGQSFRPSFSSRLMKSFLA